MRRVASAVCALAGVLIAEPGPWRKLSFQGTQGSVSAVAIGSKQIAVGLTSGGVRLVDHSLKNTTMVRNANFGANGKIWSLAWVRKDLWIASEGGLFRYDLVKGELDHSRKGIPPKLFTGVRVLLSQDSGLWCATSQRLVRLGNGDDGGQKTWNLPVEDEPTSLLKVGGQILVGTTSQGLFLLDSGSGRWTRFGRGTGMSSGQVTGLEWVGAQVFVSTLQGLDVLDLSTRQVRPAMPGLVGSWMTQVNGVLIVSTFDGLLRLDAATLDTATIALPPSVQPEGELRYGAGILVVGCGSDLLVRDQPTLLGQELPRLDALGFRIALPGPVPKGVKIEASVRLPEWPAAELPMISELSRSGDEVRVKLPSDIRGNVQIGLIARRGGRVEESRTLQGVADRVKPTLVLEPSRAVVREADMQLVGKVSGMGPMKLVVLPVGQILQIGSDGRFRQKLELSPGENRFVLSLEDGLGNRTEREIAVRRDNVAPRIQAPLRDTVDGEVGRVRVAYHDASVVRASVEPAGKARVSVFDTFVVFEARNLALGDNSWKLVLEDEVGNVASSAVHLFRKIAASQPRAGGVAQGARAVEPSKPATEPKQPSSDSSAKVATPGCDTGTGEIHVVHYRLSYGETVRLVAKKFYGKRALANILIRWNGFEDSTVWRKMPVGTPIEVPVWMDIDYGNLGMKDAMRLFPWDKMPRSAKVKK